MRLVFVTLFAFGFLLAFSSHAQRTAPRKSQATHSSTSHPAARPLPDDDTPPTNSSQPAEIFLGTWEWQSGSDIFRLVLTRNLRHRMPNGLTSHSIEGRHSFAHDGVVVQESISTTGSNSWTFLGAPQNNMYLMVVYVDKTKNKLGYVGLRIDPANANQLSFTLKESAEGAYHSNMSAPPAGFTIPASMTLTRVP